MITYAVTRGKTLREHTKLAGAKLAELLDQSNKGTFVDPSKVTMIEYLRSWLTTVKVTRRPETHRIYQSLIDTYVATAPIGAVLLQKVCASDLEKLYGGVKLAPSTVGVLHAILSRALKIAVRDRLIVANPASAVVDRPRVRKDQGHAARQNVWTAVEARRVLATAKVTSPPALRVHGAGARCRPEEVGAARADLG